MIEVLPSSIFWFEFSKTLVAVSKQAVVIKPRARYEPFNSVGNAYLNTNAIAPVGTVASKRYKVNSDQ